MAIGVLNSKQKTSKIVSISSKRQITIPQKFYDMLGFATEAEIIVENGALLIRPIRIHEESDFAEQILRDLVAEGYSGEKLLEEFKVRQSQIRPAVYRILEESRMIAEGKAAYGTIDDAFAEDEGDE